MTDGCYWHRQEDYNSIRPHSSLGRLTPEEFLAQQKNFYQEEVVL
jgi:hypothetical protein